MGGAYELSSDDGGETFGRGYGNYKAYNKQRRKEKKKLNKKIKALICIGCKEKLQFPKNKNYCLNGSVLKDNIGRGSNHKAGQIALIVCDICISKYCISFKELNI